VKKVTGGVTTVFVYNVAGQLIAEYDDLTSPPPGSGGTSYLTSDHLGSTRVVTGQDQSVRGRYDYLPFGEEVAASIGGRTSATGYSANDPIRQKFTGKERDSESGLDYFMARYYSSSQGRFISPDKVLVDQFTHNPQSWNLYSYTRNNPVRVADKDGRITPWDILDVVSLAMSIRDFWKEPSWGNAGWVAADLVGAAAPLVPVGSIRRVRQLSRLLEGAASIKNLENATEVAAFYSASQRGAVLATGQDNVRQAVGIVDGGPVADLVTLTPGDKKFIISEVKEVRSVQTGTADMEGALGQLKNTADHLLKNIPGAEISQLEIVVQKGTNLGPNFKKSGDQLLWFNSETNRYEPYRIQGKVVHVREVSPPFNPLTLK
jgi:RHS repeat-associated protein